MRYRLTKSKFIMGLQCEKALYLDIYNGGVRTYEYLKLYLIPEKNRKDKEANRQTMQLARMAKIG